MELINSLAQFFQEYAEAYGLEKVFPFSAGTWDQAIPMLLNEVMSPRGDEIERVLTAGLQERFHGRRPLAAMKPFLAGGVSCLKKSASQRFLKKSRLSLRPLLNSSEAGETKNIMNLIST